MQLPRKDTEVTTPAATPHQVAVLVYDGLCTFEFGIVADVFGYARPEMGPRWYRLVSCAVEPGPLRAVGGVLVHAEAGLEALADAETIIVPGWRRAGKLPPSELIEALREAAGRGARMISICSGAFLLAAAGLLEGRRVTTHWKYAADFRERYPDLELVPEVLYVDEGSVLTSAGSAAGIDLLLHVVRGDFGPEAANRIARGLVVPAHREGGQAQFVERPVPRRPNGRLAPLLDWMRARLDEDMSNAMLARQAAMSERTFLRRFREMTGTTPAEWLQDERVAAARQALESTNAHVEQIAAALGFGTSATLRTQFRRRLGVGPSEYRRRFGSRRDDAPPDRANGRLASDRIPAA